MNPLQTVVARFSGRGRRKEITCKEARQIGFRLQKQRLVTLKKSVAGQTGTAVARFQ